MVRDARPAQALTQLWRATLRDWWVLLREFGWALALFAAISSAVAVLFYLYYTHPEFPRGLTFDEALYAVMTITVIESAFPVPEGDGHWLIIFHFVMPIIGIILASQGLANFLTLLFNRRARGGAWTDALVSTYHDHVIVCGLGHVGSRVVASLIQAGSEVVGVETSGVNGQAARVREWQVQVVEGDARQREVLRRAGIARARAIVVCTDDDMANLEIAVHGRELNPNIRVVMRLFDEELAHRMKTILGIEDAFSTSALVAPVFAGAALNIDVDRTFNIGDEVMSVGRLTVKANGRLPGSSVGHVENSLDCSIIVHIRDGQKNIHPHDDLILMVGDLVLVLADLPTLHRLTRWNHSR
jgi:voltage-gated potassium channel